MAVGFHTTALCTTGMVSLGSRGRCFFNTGALDAGEEEDVGVVVVLDTAVRLMVVGVVKETMVTGMAIEDCVETLEGVEGTALF